MFCPKCGTQCADDAKFCKGCGSPIAMADAPVDAPGAAQLGSTAAAAMKPKRNLVPLAVAAVIAVVATVLVLIFVVKPFGSAISADDEANNISLGYGYATGADGWDYFFSSYEQGLCRAKTDGTIEMVMDVSKDNGGAIDTIGGLSADNGCLFFIKNNYSGGLSASTVCSMALDGSDVKTLFEGTSSNGGTSSYPQALYVYDHELCLLTCDYADGDTTRRVISMDEDGSNQKELCAITDDVSAIVITPEKVFYTKNNYSSNGQTLGEIYSQNLDGTGFEQVYRSSVGTVYSLAVSGDRLVFMESNYDAGKTMLASVGMDGADAKTIYQAPSDKDCSLLAVTGGYAYLGIAEASDGGSSSGNACQLARVPLEGGDVEALGGANYDFPSVSVANGHLVASSNGARAYTLGYQVRALDYAGEELATYVDSDETNVGMGATE